jgi:hypothetical protein
MKGSVHFYSRIQMVQIFENPLSSSSDFALTLFYRLAGGPSLLVPVAVRQVPKGGQGQAPEDGADELDLCQRFPLHHTLPAGQSHLI